MFFRFTDYERMRFFRKKIYIADAIIAFFVLYSIISFTALTGFQTVVLTLIFTILAYSLFECRYSGTILITLCSLAWSWIVVDILPLNKLPIIAGVAIYAVVFMAVLSLNDGFDRIHKDVMSIINHKKEEKEKAGKKAERNKVDPDIEKIDLTVEKADLVDCFKKIMQWTVSGFSYYFIGAAGTNVVIWLEPVEVPRTLNEYTLSRVFVIANLEKAGPTHIEEFTCSSANYQAEMYNKLLEIQEKYHLHYCRIFKSDAQAYYNAFVYSMQFIDGVNEHWCEGTKDRTAERQKNDQAAKNNAPVPGEEFFKGCTDLKSLTKKYHELMKKYHPDNNNGNTYTAQKVQTAYAELKRRYQQKEANN